MTYSLLGFNTELGIIMAGLIASALIGVMYFSPPSMLALWLTKRIPKARLEVRSLRWLLIPWLVSLIPVNGGRDGPIICCHDGSSASFVLITLVLAALATATKVVCSGCVFSKILEFDAKK